MESSDLLFSIVVVTITKHTILIFIEGVMAWHLFTIILTFIFCSRFDIWVLHRMLLSLNIVIFTILMWLTLMRFVVLVFVVWLMFLLAVISSFFESLPTVILLFAARILSVASTILFFMLTLFFLLCELLLVLLLGLYAFALVIVLSLDDFLGLLLLASLFMLLFPVLVGSLDVSPGLSMRHLKLILAVPLIWVDSSGTLMLILLWVLTGVFTLAMRIDCPCALVFVLAMSSVFTVRIDGPGMLECVVTMMSFIIMRMRCISTITMSISSPSMLQVSLNLFRSLMRCVSTIAEFTVPAAIETILVRILVRGKG